MWGDLCYCSLAGVRLWVLHNRAIYRRRHRRLAPLVLPTAFERDALGRTLEGDRDMLVASTAVLVVVDGHDKRFVPLPLPITDSGSEREAA